MNYLKQINDFWEVIREVDEATAHTKSLYFALLYFANKFRKESFDVYRDDVLDLSSLSKNTYYQARQLLKDKGLIDFSDGPNPKKKTRFTILLVSQNEDTKQEEEKEDFDLVSQDVSQLASQNKDMNGADVSQLMSQKSDTHYKHKEDLNLNSKDIEDVSEKIDESLPKQPKEKKERKSSAKKKESPEIPDPELPFKSEAFRQAWQEWRDYKKEIKDDYKTEAGLQKTLTRLYNESGGDEARAIEMIDYSIGKEYQGIYPPKPNYNGTHQKHQNQRTNQLRPNGTEPGDFSHITSPEQMFGADW